MSEQPSKHGHQHVPLGPDPIPGSAEPAWMAVFDNVVFGQSLSNTDGETFILFPRIKFSDNSTDILSYTADADSVLGSDWDYHPFIDIDGVYAFSWQIRCEDVSNNAAFKVITRLYPADRYPGYSIPLKDQTIVGFTTFATGFFYIDRTLVLPIALDGSPAEVILSMELIKSAAGTDVDITYSADLWITYLGPLEAASVTTGIDPGPP